MPGQTIAGDFGTLTVTGILPNGDIQYSYTLGDNTIGDATHDDFEVTVTDDDGDTATATLTINIIDDEPIARDDTDALAVGAPAPTATSSPRSARPTAARTRLARTGSTARPTTPSTA